MINQKMILIECHVNAINYTFYILGEVKIYRIYNDIYDFLSSNLHLIVLKYICLALKF